MKNIIVWLPRLVCPVFWELNGLAGSIEIMGVFIGSRQVGE